MPGMFVVTAGCSVRVLHEAYYTPVGYRVKMVDCGGVPDLPDMGGFHDAIWRTYEGGRMKTVRIDLDQKLLAAAAAIMGTSTSNATINEALRRIVVHERQLHHLERLASGALCALPGPEVITVAE